MTYRYLPHTADIKVAIEAPTLEALFGDAVTVVRHLLVGRSPVAPLRAVALNLEAQDVTELFLLLLRELLFQYGTSGFLPADLILERLDSRCLTGTVQGEHLDHARHQQEPEVKAVTRHELVVRKTDAGWYAEVLFDV
jgi:SHS2 domain-containing protein